MYQDGRSRRTDPLSARLHSACGYALGAGLGLAAWLAVASSLDGALSGGERAWLYAIDPALGVLSLVVARRRRHRPVLTALVTAALTVGSITALGGFLLTAGSIAARHRVREIALLALFSFIANAFGSRVYPFMAERRNWWDEAVWGLIPLSLLIAAGACYGWRRKARQLSEERLEAADAARRATLVAHARTAERSRIARELHDDLGRRVSLVALHAGALNHRSDLSGEEQRSALSTIEENAHLALSELRDLLGLLRPEDGYQGLNTNEDIPSMSKELTQLVDDGRAAGLAVRYDNALPVSPPQSLRATVYRVVQESLMNVQKHAPHSDVAVTLHGAAERDLVVRVENSPRCECRKPVLPSSGVGLLGLRERATLAGGRLCYGPTPAGSFVVEACLPWRT